MHFAHVRLFLHALLISVLILRKNPTVLKSSNFGTFQVWELLFFDTPILKNVLPDSLIRVQTTLQHTGNLWNDEPLSELNIAWKIFWYLYFTKINFHPSLQMNMNELVAVPQTLNSAYCS